MIVSFCVYPMIVDGTSITVVGSGILLALSYALILCLRSTKRGSSVYTLFKMGYPAFSIVLVVGLGILASLVGRFEPVVLLGVSVDLSVAWILGGGLVVVGVVGSMALLVAVGIIPEIRKNTESVEQ